MSDWKQNAAERRQLPGYAGELMPNEAWECLRTDAAAQLVDVRTPEEWAAGLPNLAELGKKVTRLSWKNSPNYTLNDQFLPMLEKSGFSKDAPIFFMCRSGGRSLDAAMAATAAGYTQCYNVTNGFEGARNGGGWKAEGLPWEQGK